MDESSKVYVGLDVHKETIAIARALSAREPARVIGEIAHDVSRLVKTLQPLGEPAHVHVVYEAGPTVLGLRRKLQALGYACEIIAPSLIPRRAGDRVKADRRDCVRLAELARAGELKAIWIADSADEAIRELSRARGDGPHEGAVAVARIPAAPRHRLSGQDCVDQDLRALAGSLELRGAGPPDRLHRLLSGRASLRREGGAIESFAAAGDPALALRGRGQGAVLPARHRRCQRDRASC